MKILMSFFILYVGGYFSGKLVKKIHLPPLIGMIAFGCIANVYLKIIFKIRKDTLLSKHRSRDCPAMTPYQYPS